MTFVFRNNTIERFLRGDYQYSGYNDFSVVPDADAYLWWYQVPLKFNISQLVEEINLYADKLRYLTSQSLGKPFDVITLVDICTAQIQSNDTRLEQAIAHFNSTAYELSTQNTNVHVIDFSNFTKRYTNIDLIDWKFYFLYQIPLNPRLANDFYQWLSKQKESLALKRKKCLILDLDNTLWAGILGEDGVEGISFEGDYPGKAFALWQEGIKQLKESGVILAICSKNNESDVECVWEKHTNMILKADDFAAKRINWIDKATNIQSIAEELNIGLDSIVFVDDNPTERELIRQMLPMVVVPEWSSHPYDLPQLYNELVDRYFQVYSLTEEDKNKTLQYQQIALRKREQQQFASLEDFIRSLQIKLYIKEVNELTLQRVAQMSQKTNQFNLTTKRYTENDILQYLDKGACIYTLSVADKFGDSGITGCIILLPNSEGWMIDTLLLSCRVLGKGIEYAFVKHVLSLFDDETIIQAQYFPTEKNSLVADFYDRLGFDLVSQIDGKKYYQINLTKFDKSIEDYYSIN